MTELRALETLVSPGRIASNLHGKISKERLLELIEAQLLPHYEVDGEIMLDWNEVKAWIEQHLIWRCPGIPLPSTYKVEIVTELKSLNDEPEFPPALKHLKPHLVSLPCRSAEYANKSGVYFLILENEIVYVGQSIRVAYRVGNHMGAKEFDWVYYLRCPKSDLDFVEGEMIRILEPKLNVGAPPLGGRDTTMQAVELVSAFRKNLSLDFSGPMHLEACKERLAHADESKEKEDG